MSRAGRKSTDRAFPLPVPRSPALGLPPDNLAVTLTIGQLRQVIHEAVSELFAQLPASGAREVLCLGDVCELLQRSAPSVRTLIEQGLPVHYISAREPRFKRSEILAWLNTLPTRPASEAQP